MEEIVIPSPDVARSVAPGLGSEMRSSEVQASFLTLRLRRPPEKKKEKKKIPVGIDSFCSKSTGEVKTDLKQMKVKLLDQGTIDDQNETCGVNRLCV